MMKKVNEWLDSPWTLRRSFRAVGIEMVIFGIIYLVTFWDSIVEWYEGLKYEHWKKSWGRAWHEDSDNEDN